MAVPADPDRRGGVQPGDGQPLAAPGRPGVQHGEEAVLPAADRVGPHPGAERLVPHVLPRALVRRHVHALAVLTTPGP